MDNKKVILLVGALLIAAVTAFFANSLRTGSATPQAVAQQVAPEPSGPMVLVAKRALPIGTIITADAYGYQPWPEELVEEAYFVQIDGQDQVPQSAAANVPVADGNTQVPAPQNRAPIAPFSASQIDGTVVRNAITAGQPITRGSLVAPGDRGFLAAALTPGMRAVSVPVSTRTGVSGFVFPGDRIDLVLTQKVNGVEGPALNVSETIIKNLRVLATDQNANPRLDEAGNTIVSAFKLVTLEATPSIAEKISVAQTIGTISLSLRALADNQSELEQAIASGSISIPEGATAEEEAEILRTAVSKPTSGKSTFATGGDVSRFQRRSVPPQTQKQAEAPKEAAKIPTVRVSRGNARTEVEVGRR